MQLQGLSASRSNGPPKPRHSNAANGIDLSDSSKSNERLALPSSETPIETSDVGAPLRKPSSEESQRQNEADELWRAFLSYMKAYTADHRLVDGIDSQLLHGKTTGEPAFIILDLSNDERSRLRVVPRFDVPVDSTSKSSRVCGNRRRMLPSR